MDTCLLCAKCCEQTEMLLANEDVTRIEAQTSLPRQKFSYLKEGYLYLKNKGKYCIFLAPETRRCSIYEIRPIGCRYYPVIYDPFSKKCVLDKDCTNKGNIPETLIKNLCPNLRDFILLLEGERNRRLRHK